MTTTPPTLHEWRGLELEPPEIKTVASLNMSIPKERYSQVYWIAQINDAGQIMELHLMKSCFFVSDGRLIGEVTAGGWKKTVEINPDEYVLLSVV